MYRTIVSGAVAGSGAPLAQQVVAGARQTLAMHALPNLDGPGSWLPVDAVPTDWADDPASARFGDLEIDLTVVAGDGPYATIGTLAPAVQIDGEPADPETAAALTSGLTGVRLGYLFVGLSRPWLDPVCSLAGPCPRSLAASCPAARSRETPGSCH